MIRLLAEDLIHNLGAARQCRHDLMPVDQLSGRRLVVPRQQRNCLHRHAVSRQ